MPYKNKRSAKWGGIFNYASAGVVLSSSRISATSSKLVLPSLVLPPASTSAGNVLSATQVRARTRTNDDDEESDGLLRTFVVSAECLVCATPHHSFTHTGRGRERGDRSRRATRAVHHRSCFICSSSRPLHHSFPLS